MTNDVQRFVLAALGLTVLHVSLTDNYLRYVQPFMRPMLLATGAVLLMLALAEALRRSPAPDPRSTAPGHQDDPGQPGAHQHDAPAMAWLLVLPVVCIMAFDPPALGSFTAERAVDVSLVDTDAGDNLGLELPPLSDQPVIRLPLNEFALRALWDNQESLQGRTVALTGFVSPRREGGWYLTRFSIMCCAADAAVTRVLVLDSPSPPVDQWVEVRGTWVRTPGADPNGSWDQQVGPSRIQPTQVAATTAPRDPYE